MQRPAVEVGKQRCGMAIDAHREAEPVREYEYLTLHDEAALGCLELLFQPVVRRQDEAGAE